MAGKWENVSEAARRMALANKSRDTGPELLLRAALRRAGLAGRYRVYRRDLPGTPDAAFPAARVAVFVDGDFWHGRAWFEGGRLPRNNAALWREKFERNRARDARADRELRAMGWAVFRVWESEVREMPFEIAAMIARSVRRRAQC